METLTQKYKAFEMDIKIRVFNKISEKGVKSKCCSDKVLKIKDGQQFTLSGDRYLMEISSTDLIDNEGYHYNLSALGIEDLCEAVDNA